MDVLTAQIEKRQAERADLEAQLAHEKMIRPVLTFEEVKFFFEKFKNGDASDYSYRTALVDTFVNKIFIYDGDDPHIEIFCNAGNSTINCPITVPKKGSSVLGQLELHSVPNTNTKNLAVSAFLYASQRGLLISALANV